MPEALCQCRQRHAVPQRSKLVCSALKVCKRSFSWYCKKPKRKRQAVLQRKCTNLNVSRLKVIAARLIQLCWTINGIPGRFVSRCSSVDNLIQLASTQRPCSGAVGGLASYAHAERKQSLTVRCDGVSSIRNAIYSPERSCITAAREVRKTAVDRSARPKYQDIEAVVGLLKVAGACCNAIQSFAEFARPAFAAIDYCRSADTLPHDFGQFGCLACLDLCLAS